jgi:hypothetical protein
MWRVKAKWRDVPLKYTGRGGGCLVRHGYWKREGGVVSYIMDTYTFSKKVGGKGYVVSGFVRERACVRECVLDCVRGNECAGWLSCTVFGR